MITKPIIICRNEMPLIREAKVDDAIHFLGEHRDFRNEKYLKQFLDGETDISLSWTHLKNGEQLDIHTHPIKSMIIICSGKGFLIGDRECELKEGDIIIIPPNTNHGFRGGDKSGFHALSIQFDDKSLYATGHKPIVEFKVDKRQLKEEFISYNNKKIQRHLQLPIFTAIQDGTLKNNVYMERMLSFLRTWSTYFQKLIMLRYVTSSSNHYGEIAKQHLVEEFGHDSLLKDRGINDNLVKSISTWFVHQMICRNDLEKHIIVHCVLENGAHSFHELCAKYLSGTADSYFNVHVVHDESHSAMGLDLILDNYSINKESILNTLDEAWDMLDLLFIKAYDIIIKK